MSGAILEAMNKARRVNSSWRAASIGEAFHEAADVIHANNDSAMKTHNAKRAGDTDKSVADDEDEPEPAKKGKKAKTGGVTYEKKSVKLINGTSRQFKAMPGGNRGCPVKCTKSHDKGATCEYSHVDKE